jgi:hypothetical protein
VGCRAGLAVRHEPRSVCLCVYVCVCVCACVRNHANRHAPARHVDTSYVWLITLQSREGAAAPAEAEAETGTSNASSGEPAPFPCPDPALSTTCRSFDGTGRIGGKERDGGRI